jgi:peptide-methionine (S)-S-oxide reductase
MEQSASLDVLIREAVSAIDVGDVAALERQLAAHANLVRDRLDSPGAWLRDKVGDALDGFFARPYLLWFVAEDPVRHGKLPANIAHVAQLIVDVAKRKKVDSLHEQLDYALRLVCWSWIARECGVSIALVDVLADAGASVDGPHVYGGQYGTNADSAIYNGNFAVAERLLERGAALTLTTALCLNRWADAERLAQSATLDEK